MRAKIQRWGNSLAVRIPKAYAIEAGLTDSTPVELSVHERGILIEPAQERRRPTLEELLEGMTADMVHEEVDWGPAAGREQW